MKSPRRNLALKGLQLGVGYGVISGCIYMLLLILVYIILSSSLPGFGIAGAFSIAIMGIVIGTPVSMIPSCIIGGITGLIIGMAFPRIQPSSTRQAIVLSCIFIILLIIIAINAIAWTYLGMESQILIPPNFDFENTIPAALIFISLPSLLYIIAGAFGAYSLYKYESTSGSRI